MYGFDDWVIRLRGLCLNEPDRSAYDQITELLQWEKIADSIPVLGDLFRDKDIYNIAIQNIDIKQIQGKPNIIPFEISALSDEPLELVL